MARHGADATEGGSSHGEYDWDRQSHAQTSRVYHTPNPYASGAGAADTQEAREAYEEFRRRSDEARKRKAAQQAELAGRLSERQATMRSRNADPQYAAQFASDVKNPGNMW